MVGVPHEEWGEAIHAEVVLRSGELAITQDDVMQHVRAQLGGYKTPKTVDLVDELPLSAVGKVLRRKVREKHWGDSQRKVG